MHSSFLGIQYGTMDQRQRRVKIREVLKTLRQDGWILKNQEGSHRQFVHPLKAGKVTVAGHESDDHPRLSSLHSKQADLK
ncbi:MAG: type II toxin-antitoxin system HicA family toxin [Bryobacteraceae bacterium]